MMKERKVRMRRKFVGAIVMLVTVASVTACGNGSTFKDVNKEVPKVEATQEPTATPEVTPEPTETPEEKTARETREFLESLPIARRAAVQSALSYMQWANFSPSGLYQQLLFEGHSESDSEFAVNSLVVDWDEMCYNKAVEYVTNIGGFSKDRLIEQLVFEGFEKKQAEKAVKRLGY